jgi:NADH-quinone oxidoreductase subunit N
MVSNFLGLNSFSFEFNALAGINAWVSIIQFSIIILSLLVITIYLPRKVESLQFLHRIGFGYLLLNLWLITLDRPFRFEVEEKVSSDVIEISYLENVLTFLQEDPFLYHVFFLYGPAVVIAFFYGILDQFFIKNGDEIEFPLLVCFLAIGVLLLLHVHTLMEFLLAIETVTLASYVFAGYERQNPHSSYASVQYFILGSIPSGMLVLSLSLLYGYAGVLTFEDLELFIFQDLHKDLFDLYYQAMQGIDFYVDKVMVVFVYSGESLELSNIFSEFSFFDFFKNIYISEELFSSRTSAILVALFLLIFNLLFKLTAAPFHFWAPSVYKYAPIASVTYLSIISKMMVIFLLFKIILVIFYPFIVILNPLFFLIAILSILFGLLGAFSERYIKPFFVYSSMGHVGFMLVALSLFNYSGISATFHYLAIYIISSFIMWFILLHMGTRTTSLSSFKELLKMDPIMALIFAFLIFSMSGIPPLGGFFIKLDVLWAFLESSRFMSNILLFFFTVASFFYYLRINKILFFDKFKLIISKKGNPVNVERFQLITLLFLCLLFYPLLVESSLLLIQSEALLSLI